MCGDLGEALVSRERVASFLCGIDIDIMDNGLFGCSISRICLICSYGYRDLLLGLLG